MGTFTHLSESGEQSSSKGHFIQLVALAQVDGRISQEEDRMLRKMALKLSITEEEAAELISNPADYNFIPPASREERYERFIHYVQLMHADGVVHPLEIKLLNKLGQGLGFTQERMNEKLPIIVAHLRNGMNREAVLNALL